MLTYRNLNIFRIFRERSENEIEDNIVVATTAEDDADKHPTGAGSIDGEAVSVSQEPAVNRRITSREKREEEIAAQNHDVQEALVSRMGFLSLVANVQRLLVNQSRHSEGPQKQRILYLEEKVDEMKS